MNLVFILVVVAVIGLALFLQKQSDTRRAATRDAVELSATEPPSAASTPAPHGQPSEGNYMKRAIDRARDVREQARARTQQAQEP